MDLDQSVECAYIANSIQFCKEGIEEELGMRLEFGTAKGKNAEERLLHLWSIDDGERRDGWENKQYHIMYQILVNSWNTIFGDANGCKWSHI